MNRREFTTSLAALAAAPALPSAAAASATPVAIPPGAYAWGQLIARAQNACSPAMLARHLNLDAQAASALFNTMLRDGVLKAPGLAGVARATQPITLPNAGRAPLNRVAAQLRDSLTETTSETPPLVNPNEAALGCDEQRDKDAAHARPDQPPEESPQTG